VPWSDPEKATRHNALPHCTLFHCSSELLQVPDPRLASPQILPPGSAFLRVHS